MEKLLSRNQAALRSSLLQAADEYDRVVSENAALLHELLVLKNLMQTAHSCMDGAGPSVNPPFASGKPHHEPASQPVEDILASDIMDERSSLALPSRKVLMPNLSPAQHVSTKKPQISEGALDPNFLFVEVSDEMSLPGSTDLEEASRYAHARDTPQTLVADSKLRRMAPAISVKSKGSESEQLADSYPSLRSGQSHVVESTPTDDSVVSYKANPYSATVTCRSEFRGVDSAMQPLQVEVGSLDSLGLSTLASEELTMVPSEKSQEGLFPKWFDPGKTEHDPALGVEQNISHHFSKADEQVDPCVVHPVGKFRITWDGVAFLSLLYELWVTPFDLVFLDSVDMPKEMTYIAHAIVIFFTMDILLNFSTGYVVGDKTIFKRRMIVKNYLRFWFWVDFVATLPWDIILSALGGGMFSMARMVKGAKILKSLRCLKLVRAARLMKALRQAGMILAHFQILEPLRIVFIPIQVSMFLCCFSHIHGCIWASLQPEWVDVQTMSLALRNYYESFWWAFIMVTSGVQYRTVDSPGAWTFEMVLSGERLLLFVYLAHRVFLNGLRYLDDVRVKHAKEDVLAYLREHRIPFATQIQVMFSLTDTGEAEKRQRKVNELLSKDLPMELVRTINEDLWIKRLMSLGIIARVSEWMPGFINEVSQSVKEEVYASRTLILRIGEPSLMAYCIISGKLRALKNPMFASIPPFTERMWVGESALVSTVLRCSATIVSEVITSLMAVSGERFQQLISKFGMMQDFQDWCAQNLWKGLCGRCGQLGSHFSDNCPYTGYHRRPSIQAVSQFGPRYTNQGMTSEKTRGASTIEGSTSTKVAALSDPCTPDSAQVGRDLLRFLQDNNLQWLRLMLREIGILTLDDLENINFEELNRRLPHEHSLSDDDWRVIAPENIKAYRREAVLRTQKALFHEVSRLHHLMFLSHYKVEAGTEAALMRTELENAMEEDPGSLGHSFDEPVFLDSENLQSLEDLQQRVINTHNLILLLTKNVLTRPWVLVEIVTARREGVRILLVNVSKPGGSFEFPDDAFYEKLRTGKYLDPEATDVMTRCGCEMAELEEALRAVFQQIAVPYSPHKAKSIRRAEIGAVLKQCKLKHETVRLDSLTRDPTSPGAARASMTYEEFPGFQLKKGRTWSGRETD